VPHGRVRSIDMSAALAMPGVKAIITVDDLPAPADSLTDNGTVIPANKLGERGLTMEPVYQGEPILAVCRGRRAHRRRSHRENPRRLSSGCRSWSIRSKACGPADPMRERRGQRLDASSGRRRTSAPGPGGGRRPGPSRN
jgi:xanthine dehydrogenase molybdopterin-binding subunit B